MKYDIVVIGGGPAGIFSAITAAKRHKKVCIIEHTNRLGKKILSTGNGKCNLTNMYINPECYNCDSSTEFFQPIQEFTPIQLRQELANMGLLTKERNGYVYPNSEQATSVLETLLSELDLLKVKIYTETEVTKIDQHYRIKTNQGVFEAPRLIIACGSKSAPKTGSDGSGYVFAPMLGHSIIQPIPALVQLKCKEKYFKELHGVRIDAKIYIKVNQDEIISEKGELQLTEYGISGIPVFQISRHVKRLLDQGANPLISIDYMPNFTKKDLFNILKNCFYHNVKQSLLNCLCGVFNKKLAMVLLKISDLNYQDNCALITDKKINKLISNIKAMKVTPTDTNGFVNAQVCAGGVSMKEINSNTMESLISDGLYWIGEIVDVDGICGGYNLQWAFSTGYVAGKHAAKDSSTGV